MISLANGGTVTAATHPAQRSIAAMSVLRIFAGAISWVNPSHASKLFGVGSVPPDARTGLLSRLFGVRDLALGLAVRHPNADVRRTALQVGVAIDSADIVASLIAVRAGAPRTSLLGVAAGAALFVGLGIAGLADTRSR